VLKLRHSPSNIAQRCVSFIVVDCNNSAHRTILQMKFACEADACLIVVDAGGLAVSRGTTLVVANGSMG
jgi:hypothetical protein